MRSNDTPTPDSRAATPAAFNRKYRPQSFDSNELVGQEHVVRTLKNAIRTDRVAQAYLFCGPRGTGKTSTARILAKAVNCLDPDPDKRPCNECAACVAINSGATPDVIEIDAASNRGIDDIRDLRERVNYAPSQLRTKFYIIDEAHQITGAAANAFLKTLEEPPAHARFVLATTDPEELLPTIVSRCQRFDFRRHTREGIASRIATLAEREGIKLAPDAIDLVSELAHGSMRDPVGLLEQLANYQHEGDGGGEIDAAAVRELVGISRSELALSIVQAIADRNIAAALAGVNEAVQAGQDVRQLNRQITGLIRDTLLVASGLTVPEFGEELRAIAAKRSIAELAGIAERFLDTDSQIRASVIPQLPIELAILGSALEPGNNQSQPAVASEQAQPGPITSTERPRRERTSNDERVVPGDTQPENGSLPSQSLTSLARDRNQRRSIREEPSPTPASPTNDPAADGQPVESPQLEQRIVARGDGAGLTVERFLDMWSGIRADVKSLDRRIEALMLEIDPVDVSDDRVILLTQFEFHRNMLNDPSRRTVIEEVVSRRVGKPIRIEVMLRTEFDMLASPASTETTIVTIAEDVTPDPQSTEERDDDGERLLGAVIRMFDGEIVSDEEESP